jgi:hypothetical protein
MCVVHIPAYQKHVMIVFFEILLETKQKFYFFEFNKKEVRQKLADSWHFPILPFMFYSVNWILSLLWKFYPLWSIRPTYNIYNLWTFIKATHMPYCGKKIFFRKCSTGFSCRTKVLICFSYFCVRVQYVYSVHSPHTLCAYSKKFYVYFFVLENIICLNKF